MSPPRTAFVPSLHATVLTRPRPILGCSQRRTVTRRSKAVTMKTPDMPDSAKRAVASGEDVQYWQGEWICVDCGFVYKPKRKIKFEDLPSTWKCPQCNAPKRRFAKKAGDFIAETASTSNAPIVVFSIVGLLATIGFGFWASQNL